MATTPDTFAPTVQLTSGKVRGRVVEGDQGRQVNFYQGVKYGESKRFEKAQFAAPWEGVYDATRTRDSCYQPVFDSPTVAAMTHVDSMSEDCLYLNVWRPVEESKSPRSVLVFIHGGGFVMGSVFAPFTDTFRFLASQEDLVVVAINYRLGEFGFMHGGDVPANLGIHDQILGLKWVQQNIAQFGGDPNAVTISGHSAGSMSVGILVLSPLTKGLFRRAIMHGGAPNTPYWCTSPEVVLEKTKRFARELNCPASELDDIQRTMNWLKSQSAEEIHAHQKMNLGQIDFFVSSYGDELLPVSPVEALREGKLPNRNIDLLVSVAKDEGAFFAGTVFPKLLSPDETLTVESVKKDIVQMMGEVYKLEKADEIAQFYTEKLANPSQDDLKLAIASAWGDFHLAAPTMIFGEWVARHLASDLPNNHYFGYRMMQALFEPPGQPKWMAVGHGQDAAYLYVPQVGESEQAKLGRALAGAVAAFVKTGKVGNFGGKLEWTETLDGTKGWEQSSQYLSLDGADLKMDTSYTKDTCAGFWLDRIKQT